MWREEDKEGVLRLRDMIKVGAPPPRKKALAEE